MKRTLPLNLIAFLLAIFIACVVGLTQVDLRCKSGDRSTIDGHDLCPRAGR